MFSASSIKRCGRGVDSIPREFVWVMHDYRTNDGFQQVNDDDDDTDGADNHYRIAY